MSAASRTSGGTCGAALAAARRGWYVFPTRPGRKVPAVPDTWERRAVSDPELVARYWPSDRHGVGVACGPSRLVVVDCDVPTDGKVLPEAWLIPGVVDGSDVLAVLADGQGPDWLDTYTVRTPLGGVHQYYRALPDRPIRNSGGRIGPLVDVRGAGGYVLGAGSVVDRRAYLPDRPEAAALVGDGKPYEVIHDVDPIPLPAWLAGLADPPQPARPRRLPVAGPADGAVYARLRGVLATVLDAPEGERNNTLHWASCRAGDMVAAEEIDEQTAVAALIQAAVAVGLSEGEAERTVRSGMRGAA